MEVRRVVAKDWRGVLSAFGPGSSIRRSLPICALMLLSVGAWDVLDDWILPIIVGLSVGVFLLSLAGAVLLARTPSATEAGEPHSLARAWLVLTSSWSVGLLYTSLWLGTFEQDWAFLFFLTILVAVLAWIYVLAKLVINRQRPLASQDSRGPRSFVLVWLTASALFCSLCTFFSARESLSALAVAIPVLVTLPVIAWILLLELPLRVAAGAGELRRGQKAAITLLRAMSFTVAILLCASCRPLDSAPPAQVIIFAGLTLLGGVHVALETVIRELPRGARTVWLGSLATVLAALAATLVTFDLPRRAAFELFRARFDASVAEVRDGWQRVGLWRVYRRDDPRGGEFLETWSGGMDSDAVLHIGFAHSPNGEGTAFGDLRVELQTLGGDWYEFRAWEPRH